MIYRWRKVCQDCGHANEMSIDEFGHPRINLMRCRKCKSESLDHGHRVHVPRLFFIMQGADKTEHLRFYELLDETDFTDEEVELIMELEAGGIVSIDNEEVALVIGRER